MTGPAVIALLCGITAALLILTHQHRSTTQHTPHETETGHGQENPHQAHEEHHHGPREEDHPQARG